MKEKSKTLRTVFAFTLDNLGFIIIWSVLLAVIIRLAVA